MNLKDLLKAAFQEKVERKPLFLMKDFPDIEEFYRNSEKTLDELIKKRAEILEEIDDLSEKMWDTLQQMMIDKNLFPKDEKCSLTIEDGVMFLKVKSEE